MFAALVIDREPLHWADLPETVLFWLQSVGGLASICLGGGVLLMLATRSRQTGSPHLRIAWTVLTAVAYAIFFVTLFADQGSSQTREYLLAGAGALGLLGVLAPIVYDFARRVSWFRIFGLAKLSLKEAVRSRVILLFAVLALMLLFIGWFIPYKEQYQVRSYVRVIYYAMAMVFLLAFTFLGAFSIPTDIKRQTIHTIVTKPVQRIEIVLGRFLGFGALLTIGMALWTLLSYGYLLRGVTEEAARESFKARIPAFAQLGFWPLPGESVGREFDYRRYIAGPHPSQPPGTPRKHAVYSFNDLPEIGRNPQVRFEYTFDIFRLVKGDEEGKGIYCTFTFIDGLIPLPLLDKMKEAMKERRNELLRKGSNRTQVELALMEEFHIFELSGEEVRDYVTQAVQVPNEFFQVLAKNPKPRLGPGEPPPPAFRVLIHVSDRSPSQMVGFAPRDMYLLNVERGFAQNFVKGILGMWLLTLLALGMAIALSTYLSAVIAWLTTLFLLVVGLPLDFIKELSENRAVGGGPVASMMRMVQHKPMSAPLDDQPGAQVVEAFDTAFAWYLKRFLLIIPDVKRFDLTNYVGNGFDVSWGELMGLNLFLYWVGYLLPWFILAYYLMLFREIALPT